MKYYLFILENDPRFYSEGAYIFKSTGRKYRYKRNPTHLRYSGKIVLPFNSSFKVDERVEPIGIFSRELSIEEFVTYKLKGKL